MLCKLAANEVNGQATLERGVATSQQFEHEFSTIDPQRNRPAKSLLGRSQLILPEEHTCSARVALRMCRVELEGGLGALQGERKTAPGSQDARLLPMRFGIARSQRDQPVGNRLTGQEVIGLLPGKPDLMQLDVPGEAGAYLFKVTQGGWPAFQVRQQLGNGC